MQLVLKLGPRFGQRCRQRCCSTLQTRVETNCNAGSARATCSLCMLSCHLRAVCAFRSRKPYLDTHLREAKSQETRGLPSYPPPPRRGGRWPSTDWVSLSNQKLLAVEQWALHLAEDVAAFSLKDSQTITGLFLSGFCRARLPGLGRTAGMVPLATKTLISTSMKGYRVHFPGTAAMAWWDGAIVSFPLFLVCLAFSCHASQSRPFFNKHSSTVHLTPQQVMIRRVMYQIDTTTTQVSRLPGDAYRL